ncbi:type II toxin-antitoxin system HicA family toxin [Rippkaea orientalis]|uniref:type II toxin-antitoxin system HicA family toxin n=1 Tax=Rippkaea orientalis TaxID=2546366 RepID=UPI00059CE8D5
MGTTNPGIDIISYILVCLFGFELARINGSHHIYIHPNIPELINIQNRKGEVTTYQVRQALSLINRYNLTLDED